MHKVFTRCTTDEYGTKRLFIVLLCRYRDLPDNYKTYGIVSASYGSAYDIGLVQL